MAKFKSGRSGNPFGRPFLFAPKFIASLISKYLSHAFQELRSLGQNFPLWPLIFSRNLKDQLTAKELKFIENYLLGDLNVDEAMIAAGYTGYHPKSLYRWGRKIVEKYETQATDRRQIARAIGAGEVTIFQGLLELAKGARSEQVRCRAYDTLASILGLKGELTESYQGVSITIYS
jgi:hypothetical protein